MGKNRDESPEAVKQRLILKSGQPVHQGYQRITLTPRGYEWVCPTCHETTEEEEAQPKLVICDNDSCGASFFTDPPQHIVEGKNTPEWRQGFPEKNGFYYYKHNDLAPAKIIVLFGTGTNLVVKLGDLDSVYAITDLDASGWFRPVDPMSWEDI